MQNTTEMQTAEHKLSCAPSSQAAAVNNTVQIRHPPFLSYSLPSLVSNINFYKTG